MPRTFITTSTPAWAKLAQLQQLGDLPFAVTGTEQRFKLYFRIDNPNDSTLTVRGLTYRIQLDAIKLAEGEYIRLAIKCPRCGTLNQFQSAPSASLSERQPSVQPLKRSNDESNFSHIHPARPGHDPQRRAQSLPG